MKDDESVLPKILRDFIFFIEHFSLYNIRYKVKLMRNENVIIDYRYIQRLGVHEVLGFCVTIEATNITSYFN